MSLHQAQLVVGAQRACSARSARESPIDGAARLPSPRHEGSGRGETQPSRSQLQHRIGSSASVRRIDDPGHRTRPRHAMRRTVADTLVDTDAPHANRLVERHARTGSAARCRRRRCHESLAGEHRQQHVVSSGRRHAAPVGIDSRRRRRPDHRSRSLAVPARVCVPDHVRAVPDRDQPRRARQPRADWPSHLPCVGRRPRMMPPCPPRQADQVRRPPRRRDRDRRGESRGRRSSAHDAARDVLAWQVHDQQ